MARLNMQAKKSNEKEPSRKKVLMAFANLMASKLTHEEQEYNALLAKLNNLTTHLISNKSSL